MSSWYLKADSVSPQFKKGDKVRINGFGDKIYTILYDAKTTQKGYKYMIGNDLRWVERDGGLFYESNRGMEYPNGTPLHFPEYLLTKVI